MVLVSKQMKTPICRAINIFMEIKDFSSNGKMQIRDFRPVSLRGQLMAFFGGGKSLKIYPALDQRIPYDKPIFVQDRTCSRIIHLS